MGVRAGIAAGALLVAAAVAGCSDDDSSSDDADNGAAENAEDPVEQDSGAEDSTAEVRSETITIEDPQLGELTFDALTAGDSAAAAEGRLVLLLHGFPETAESFREILPALAEEGYYAVAPNQRGYSPGARPTNIEAYGIVNLVGDVKAIADQLGADRFHVVGHDWGGAVAWVTAILHQDAVETLAALSTPHPDAINAVIGDPNNPQSQASSYTAAFRAPGSENGFLANGAEAFFTGIGIPEDHAAAYAEVLGTPEALGAALNWYRANPLPIEARLGPVGQPTLYMWGDEDIAFTRGTAEATAALVEGRYTFEELPGRGHWLPEEVPDEVAAALLDHLAAA